MKKTYIVPEILVIKLTSRSMVAISMFDGEINKEEDVLVKEQTGGSWYSGNKSVWDNEW